MSEYWKSNAKKFCQICKTWYADNKISIENHERGTKHKVMVQQRLRESAQKAQCKEREQAELNSTLRQMEQAALASMLGYGSKRQEEPPRAQPVGPKPISKTERERREFKAQKKKLEELKRTSGQSQFWDDAEKAYNEETIVTASLNLEKEWVQAQHESGHYYYWHVCSGETQWELPPGGFYTTAEYNEKYATMMTDTTPAATWNSTDSISNETHTSAALGQHAKALQSISAGDYVPSFTIMPQSSLASLDPFATTDSRQRRTEKRKTNEYSEEASEKFHKDHSVIRVTEKPKFDETEASVEWELKTDNSEDAIPRELPLGNHGEENANIRCEQEERPVHPLGQWVPVVKEEKEKRVISDLPEQVIKKKPSEIVSEMEMDPTELQFQEKVLSTQSTKKSAKAVQFRKRSFANKGNLRQRTD